MANIDNEAFAKQVIPPPTITLDQLYINNDYYTGDSYLCGYPGLNYHLYPHKNIGIDLKEIRHHEEEVFDDPEFFELCKTYQSTGILITLNLQKHLKSNILLWLR